MRRTMMACVAALVLAASPAFGAGGDKGDWELGIFGGYGWLDDYGPFNPENQILYGARIGYFLTSHWGLELSGQRLSTNADSDSLPFADVDVRLAAFRLNLLYNFGSPGAGVRPFLTGGIGSEKFDADIIEESKMGWNVGGGFRFFLSPKWNLRLEGRYVSADVGDFAFEETQHNVEAMLGLGVLLGGGGGEAEVQAEAPPNQPPTVSCVAERMEVLPGEVVNVSASASDPEGGPLTYEWTTTSGRVTGTGASAALDFTGATAPVAATISVRVTDDHGLTATSDCAVRLIEPVRKAEAVSCIAGGFPRNLARITNVDKACLDDVAQRLSADPRATVVIIGHSDPRETTKDIAQKRADAVRGYLVTERSVDGARITVRSSAGTKPLESGTDAVSQSRNRRVEVWFVPEGATITE